MDAVSLLVHLVFKTFFLALPVGVAWLAFRRLSMSESRNAWLYSAIGLFASFSAAGLAPWALGFTGASWVFLLLSLISPPLWLATVVLCDLRESRYGDTDEAEMSPETFQTRRHAVAPEAPSRPLVLADPVVEQSAPPMPAFRHRRPDLEPPLIRREPAPAPYTQPATSVRHGAESEARPTSTRVIPGVNAPRKVLDVARDMRGDGPRRSRKDLVTVDAAHDLPFLRGTA